MGRRILTSAVALPLLLFIVWQGGAWFAAFIGLVAGLGAWELSRMAESWGQRPISPAATVLAAALAMSPHLIPDSTDSLILEIGSILIALLALSSAAILLLAHRRRGPYPLEDDKRRPFPSFPRSLSSWKRGAGIHTNTVPGLAASILVTFCIVMMVGGTLFHATLLHSLAEGRSWVFLLLGVTFATDTAAYFVGRAVGSRPLAPNISPNKTWEGAIAGFLGALACGVGLHTLLSLDAGVVRIALMSAALGVSGQLGDLLESRLKRLAGFDDSGKIIPGHGGILDRMDSLMWNIVIMFHWI